MGSSRLRSIHAGCKAIVCRPCAVQRRRRLGVPANQSAHAQEIGSMHTRRCHRFETEVRMTMTAVVTEQTLVEGAWYAAEQAGRLLASATLLCDAGDPQSGLVMAMFGCEEVGRSRLLMAAAWEVRSGATLSNVAISERCRIDLAAYTLRGITDADSAAALTRRHAARMGSTHVDLIEDGTGWQRPADVDGKMALNEVICAVNDYAIFLERFRPTQREALQAVEPRPDLEVLMNFKPASLTLPPPVWPGVREKEATPGKVNHASTGNAAVAVAYLKTTICAFAVLAGVMLFVGILHTWLA